MTSKLTREQLHERARENVKALKMASRQTAFESAREEILADLQLAELALAAMDSEPVAYMYRDNLHSDARFSLESKIGNWSPEDISEFEISETPLYRHAQPALVVPDEIKHRIGGLDWGWEGEFNRGWNACRAAMLAAAPQSPGSEPATVPGKWIPVSERMPDDDDFVYIWPRPDFGVELHVGQYCECSPKGDGWYAQVYEQNYGIEWHPITVTHWMPLPAAPQEVR